MDFEFVRNLAMAANQLTKHVGVKVLEIGKELMGMTSGWIKLSQKFERGNEVLSKFFLVRN